MCYYYQFSFYALIFVWVANTVAVNISIPEENWKKLIESAEILCACSNYTLNSTECPNREKFLAVGSEQFSKLDEVCDNIKKIAGMVDKSVDDKLMTGTKGDGKEKKSETKGDDKGEIPETKGDGKEKKPETKGDGKGENPETKGDGKEEKPKTKGDGKGEIPETKGDGKEKKPETKGDGKGKPETKGDGKGENPGMPPEVPDDKNKTKSQKNTGDDLKAIPGHLKNDSPKEAKVYSLTTLVTILFCSFGAGIMVAVGAKLAYDRYRKRSYVLPPEQGMQL